MPFQKGHKHNENWYKAVRKPRPEHVRIAISRAQKGRIHQSQEGFQEGHKPLKGTEKTRFYEGQPSWNKGNRNFDTIKRKLRTYRANAKRANREFEITLEEMRIILSKPCVYCGEQSTGIDRVDNAKGYINGNMDPCCKICNHMKNNLTKENFIKKVKQIVTVTGYEI